MTASDWISTTVPVTIVPGRISLLTRLCSKSSAKLSDMGENPSVAFYNGIQNRPSGRVTRRRVGVELPATTQTPGHVTDKYKRIFVGIHGFRRFFSKSRMHCIVASISCSLVSTTMASAAGTRGATARLLSRSSRPRMSPRTVS